MNSRLSATGRRRLAETQRRWTRRRLLQYGGMGLGSIALTSLLQRDGVSDDGPGSRADPLAPRPPQFSARAKSVIYVHLVGAPSHLDLFDYKPALQQRSGQLCPDEFFQGKQLAFIRKQPTLLGTPEDKRFRFSRCGDQGLYLSDLLPRLQQVADKLTFVHSLQTEQFNHAPAQLYLLTGFPRFGRPSIGSWTTYGLGSENADLPGFVVMVTGQVLGAGNSAWGSGFLPTVYQGIEFRSQGDPVLFLSNPSGVMPPSRKRVIDAVNQVNRAALADVGDPEIATRINQYEMAYRMQSSVPELMDIQSEPQEVHQLYGTQPGKTSFANNCLLARRLVQRGVRFVQLFDQGWDMHNNLFARLPKKCAEVDRPLAALITDLDRLGMLEDTLVVWSSEFGRTPMAQAANGQGKMASIGRDHHKQSYTIWMAGAGLKPGFRYGRTDELGYNPIEHPMQVHDLNATILYLLGMDHERLTFKYQGRPFRLTDIYGNVVKDLLA